MDFNQYFLIQCKVMQDKNLTLTERVIYSYILNYWRSNLKCFASNNTMAQTLGISRDKVIKAIKQLNKLGYIAIKQYKNSREIYKPYNQQALELEELFQEVIKDLKLK